MPAPDAFRAHYGFQRGDVSLENWRLKPYSVWSFHNVSEIVPSATIFASGEPAETEADDPSALLAETVAIGGRATTIGDFLQRSDTDALVVMKAGRFVADYHAPHYLPRARHIVFSISKSLTALLAGILQDDGLLDPEAPITAYAPEVAGSAYGDATVRNLLDMTVSLDFEEVYLDPHSAFGRYRRAMLWNPPIDGGVTESLLDFLPSIGKGPSAHGGPFRYRSPNSDLLGVVVERASGMRYADLMSKRLWGRLGARSDAMMTVDRKGTARAAGGISTTARDLARVGEMMRRGGYAGDNRIVSEAWLADTLTKGSHDAWLNGDFPHLLPNGRYRNKWYQTGYASGAFFAIGIHGQWLYVDPPAETVIVKFSSQPVPVDDPLDLECLAFFQAISAMALP